MSETITFAELSAKYDELKGDFERYKERTQQEHQMCERTSQGKFCVEVILPLYDAMQRAWSNTGSQDIFYFLKELKNKLTEMDFIIMDEAFFKLLFNNLKDRNHITNIAEILRCTYTNKENEHNTVAEVFSVGVLDSITNKIIKYPRVTINVYKK